MKSSDAQAQLGHLSRLRGGEGERRDHISDITRVGLVIGFGLLVKHDFQASGIISRRTSPKRK